MQVTTPASMIPTATRATPEFTTPKITAATAHAKSADAVSSSGRLNTSRRWASVGGRPSRTHDTARRSSRAFSGSASSSMTTRYPTNTGTLISGAASSRSSPGGNR